MKRYHFGVVLAVVLMAGIGSPETVHAQVMAPPDQEVAPPIAVEPHHIEISAPEAPMQMRAEDALHLLRELGIPTTATAPQAAPAPPVAAPPSTGVSRAIHVEPAEVVNHSPQFKFKDVTERAESQSPTLSMTERHAAVEAYRQSLVKAGGATR